MNSAALYISRIVRSLPCAQPSRHPVMAVGALHLPGDQGVIQLLRKQGFTVTAVN